MSGPQNNVAVRDAVAKAIADAIGHGMAEKCYTHADAAIAALQAQQPAAAAEIPPPSPDWLELVGVALQVADSTCRSDIECECTMVVVDRHDWYDTAAPALAYAAATAEDSRAWIDRAMGYFKLRGEQAHGFRVIRSATYPHLVRFEDTP